MALWTEVIDPATLTGYTRAAMADYEVSKGTLAMYLPNQFVPDISVRFQKGATGLIDVANFRAYDAELEIGGKPSGQRVTLELPALGKNFLVSEYEQIRARQGTVSPAQALIGIQNTAKIAARSVADRMELQRAITLDLGINTITQNGAIFAADDFGRDPALRYTAPALWSVAGTDRLGQLQTAYDLYTDKNGEEPGETLMSTRAFRALQSGTQFQTQLLNGGARNASSAEVRQMVEGAGLPPIRLYDRRVQVNGVSQKALADDRFYMLPKAVNPTDAGGTQLGGTWWGRTLTSLEAAWGIEEADQPGIVTGVYRNEKPPMVAEVMADAIGEPVLANANLSMSVKVL